MGLTATANPKDQGNANVLGSELELNRAIEDLRGVAARGAAPSLSETRSGAGISPVTLQIPIEVNILLGSAEMNVSELGGLQAGSTIALDRRVGEPLDVVVNGVKIARGELFLMETDPNRFGFRITGIAG